MVANLPLIAQYRRDGAEAWQFFSRIREDVGAGAQTFDHCGIHCFLGHSFFSHEDLPHAAFVGGFENSGGIASDLFANFG